MFETKISLNACDTCSECGRKFRNEEEIYLFSENGKFYCDCCTDELKENRSKASFFRRYYVFHGNAVMVFEDNAVSVLDDGLYKIFKPSWTIEKFGNESKELWPQVFHELEYEKSSGCDIVEIRNHRAVYFFSGSKWAYNFSIDLRRDTYEDIYDDICPNGKYEECYFVVLMYQVIGLTTKEGAESIADFKTFGYGNLVVKPYEEVRRLAGKNKFQRMLCSALQKLTPSVMLEECRKRVQGQPMVKNAVFIIYNYLMALENGKLKNAENWLLTAPSGSGKTEFYRVVRDVFKEYNIPVPVTSVDLSLITEAGYRGENVDSIHDKLMEADPETDGYGICFLDEADKKFLPSHTSKGDNVNSAVQSNLLTLIEGTVINTRKRTYDTAKTMFIFLGSFQDIRDGRQERHSKKSLGFSSEQEQTADFTDVASGGFYDDISLQEMIDYGMKEELAGRITRVINFGKIPEEDMKCLIRSKANEIACSMGINVEIGDKAVDDFLASAYGTLGVRRPMNIMRELIQDALSEVFFDDSFDIRNITVEIKSTDRARVKTHRKTRFTA